MVPSFKTKRLILESIKIDDAKAYRKHFVDYEVIRHLSHLVPWPYPDDGVETFLRSVILPEQGVSRWTWTIRLKDAPAEIIGCVDLWREGKPENRGFWLGKKFWGEGFMTEAVEPVMDYAFDQLGFDQLTFANALGNERSRRVKEKTGARFLRTEPAKLVDPSYTESEIWVLTKEDWTEFKSKQIS